MQAKKTICLNMIVKDEAHVIRRCLDSVKGLIDYWVIVDTGSSDGTQGVIREHLRDIPGEMHERPWVNFGHNRNEALDLARGKADYFLFIDADDKLVFSDTFVMPPLEKDVYQIIQRLHGKAEHNCLFLIKDLPGIKWEGVVHERVSIPGKFTWDMLLGVTNIYMQEGNRSKDPDRYKKDAEMLEIAHREDPSNTRTVFYLALSYAWCDEFQSAHKYLRKRAVMGGREDEVFYSLYGIGSLQKELNLPLEDFLKTLCKAYERRPTRAEPVYLLAKYFWERENYFLGYLLSKHALSIPFSDDLFIEPWTYDWGALELYYHCCYQLGKYPQAYKALQELLAKPNFPLEERKKVEHHIPHLERLLTNKDSP